MGEKKKWLWSVVICLISFRRLYNKNARRYSVYALKSEKNYSYIPELQERILKRRLVTEVGMPRRRSLRPDDPRRLGLVPPIPAPATSELVPTQVRRGLGKSHTFICLNCGILGYSLHDKWSKMLTTNRNQCNTILTTCIMTLSPTGPAFSPPDDMWFRHPASYNMKKSCNERVQMCTDIAGKYIPLLHKCKYLCHCSK